MECESVEKFEPALIETEAGKVVAGVLEADFRYLLQQARECQGDPGVLDTLIEQMAAYRAQSWCSMMLECIEGGESMVEARIAKALGEMQ